MTNEQTSAGLFCVIGLLLSLVNKPLGELCRQWDMRVFGRDLGIRSFRIPILLMGAALLSIGLALLLF
jgi:hypothetical protein